jgi:Hypervirulence associated proteins TUDOR domain
MTTASATRKFSPTSQCKAVANDKEITMAKKLKEGDQVEWDTSQGKTHGTVERKQTSRTHIKAHMVAASKNNPQYIVKSDKSAKKAAHKPEELRKKS